MLRTEVMSASVGASRSGWVMEPGADGRVEVAEEEEAAEAEVEAAFGSASPVRLRRYRAM